MKTQKRFGISVVAMVILSLATCNSSSALEFEVEGTAFLKIHGSWVPVRAAYPTNTFKVYVKDCQWLIEVKYPGRGSEQGNRRQVGSSDGREIYELSESMPLTVISNPPPSVGSLIAASKLPSVYSATIVSNAVHINPDGNSISGQLWQTFASACYLKGLQTNRVTPSFKLSQLPVSGTPNASMPADWTLLDGRDSLPSRFQYLSPEGFADARYEVLEQTNLSGTIIPTRILFEKFESAYPGYHDWVSRVTHSVMISVNSVRPVCSITNFIPSLTMSAKVTDYRPWGPRLSYTTDRWVNLEEARKLSRDTQKNVAALLPQVPVQVSWLIADPEQNHINLFGLATRLFQNPDRLTRFISDKMSPSVRNLLKDSYLGWNDSQRFRPPQPLCEAVALELNKLISEERLYDKDRAAGVKLKEDTLGLISQRGTMNDDVRLNRLLLEDAYPYIIPQSVRILADSSAPYMILVDSRKKTFQFYEEDGKKGEFVDFDMLTERNQSMPSKRGYGFSTIRFDPDSVGVQLDSCVYQITLHPFVTNFRASR